MLVCCTISSRREDRLRGNQNWSFAEFEAVEHVYDRRPTMTGRDVVLEARSRVERATVHCFASALPVLVFLGLAVFVADLGVSVERTAPQGSVGPLSGMLLRDLW